MLVLIPERGPAIAKIMVYDPVIDIIASLSDWYHRADRSKVETKMATTNLWTNNKRE